MAQEPMNRQEYIRQVRAQFHASEKEQVQTESLKKQWHKQDESEQAASSNPHPTFWKARLFVAFLLFLGFVALRQTNTQWHCLSKDSIVQRIKSDDQWKQLTSQLKKLDIVSLEK